jgi:CRISPR-associated protein Cas2
MIDLPVKTKVDQKNYNKFHRFTINNGFIMIQFSIYVKLCLNFDEVAN